MRDIYIYEVTTTKGRTFTVLAVTVADNQFSQELIAFLHVDERVRSVQVIGIIPRSVGGLFLLDATEVRLRYKPMTDLALAYEDAAVWVARRGGTGSANEPLPPQLPGQVRVDIEREREAFMARVAVYKAALALEAQPL